MRKHNQPKSMKLILAVVVLLVISQVVLYSGIFTSPNEGVNEEDWQCVQTACAKVMSESEVIKEFCRLSDTGEAVCDVNADGQTQVIPLVNLNISAFQVCAEQVCLAESLIRETNYTIEQNTQEN